MATDLTSITKAIKDLQDEVAQEKTVDEGAVKMLGGLSDQVTKLAAEVASLKAGTVTQDQIDAIASTISGTAAQIKANATGLAAAVAAVPAETPQPATGDQNQQPPATDTPPPANPPA